MRELSEWWQEMGGSSRPWLLLGKGPSLERRNDYDLSPYLTVAINHVARELPVDVTSVVNFSVLEDCSRDIDRNSRYLLMPRYPHTIAGDAPLILEGYFDQFPILEKLSREGRLVWYNLSSDPILPNSPVIENGSFSTVILFNLIGAMGGREIRSLGIDGGQNYGNTFRDLANRTRLANGMKTYDYQFIDMARAIKMHHLHYQPLNSNDLRLRLMMAYRMFRRHIRTNPRAAIKRLLSGNRRRTDSSPL